MSELEAKANLAQQASGSKSYGDKTNSTIISSSPYHGLWALTNRELKKWYKNPVILLLSLIQPVLWLGLFGKAMNFGAIFAEGGLNIPGLNIPKEVINQLGNMLMLNVFGTSDYFSFLAVGMLSFIIIFTAMFSGMSIVWDRRLGTLNKVMSTPVARGSIVMSKILSSVIRSLVQAAIILVLAVLLGMNTSKMTFLGIIGAFASLVLLSFGFSAVFLMLALRSTNQNTQMAIVNLLNLPLLFGSNALFPANLMPEWLQAFVKVNPISYATDIGRQLLLGAEGMGTLAFDFAYLTAFAAVFSIVGIVLSWRFLTK